MVKSRTGSSLPWPSRFSFCRMWAYGNSLPCTDLWQFFGTPVTLRIYITGRVALEVDGQVVVDERRFRGKQGRLVFAYLLCEQARPVPRDELASVVWQQDFPPSWEVALSALISRLQRILSSGSRPLLVTHPGTVPAKPSAGCVDRPGGRLFRHRQSGVRYTNGGPRGSAGARHRCGDNCQTFLPAGSQRRMGRLPK